MIKVITAALMVALFIGYAVRGQDGPLNREVALQTILGTWEEDGNTGHTFGFQANDTFVLTKDGKRLSPRKFSIGSSTELIGQTYCRELLINGDTVSWFRFTDVDHVTFTAPVQVEGKWDTRSFHRRFKYRIWQDLTGKFKVSATFVRVKGDQVILETRADKVEITVSLAKLSDVDRQYVQPRLSIALEKIRLEEVTAHNQTINSLRNRGMKITVLANGTRTNFKADLTEFSHLSVSFEEDPTDVDLQHLLSLNKIHPIVSIASGGRFPDESLGLQITDTGLANLKAMTSLQNFNINKLLKVTDAGLEHLRGLTSLTTLKLSETKITDAGLEHLKGLTNLKNLYLGGTKITDAGIEHLKGTLSLGHLDLNATSITDAGLEHLKEMFSLRSLYLLETQVTGAGLAHLKGLSNLETLNFDCSKISKTGLVNLVSIRRLKWLNTPEKEMTVLGYIQLAEHIPNCIISGGLSTGERFSRRGHIVVGLEIGISLSAFKKLYSSAKVTKIVGYDIHVATVSYTRDRYQFRPDVITCFFWEGKLYKTTSRYEGDRLGEKGLNAIITELIGRGLGTTGVPDLGPWDGYPTVKQVSKGGGVGVVGVVNWSFPRVNRFVTSESAANKYLEIDIVDTMAENKIRQKKKSSQ